MNFKEINSELNEEHLYAVGLLDGGFFCPLQSYSTREQLEEGFEKYYFSSQNKFTKPIPVERKEMGKWDGSSCIVLRGLMDKVIINSRRN